MERPVKTRRIPRAVADRPTGSIVLVASAVALIAHRFGVEIGTEEVAIVLGAIGVIVSWFTPRN